MAAVGTFLASIRSSAAGRALGAWAWLPLLAVGLWLLIVASGRSWDRGALWTLGIATILAGGVLVLRDPARAAWRRWRQSQRTNEASRADGDVQRTVAACGVAFLAGLLALMVFAYASVDDTPRRIDIVGTGLLLGGASALLGALLGFLFGIPRTLQSASETAAPTDASSSATSPDLTRSYSVNTNLEQISDWLTKILVGVGLTQFDTVVDRVWNIAGALEPTFGGQASGGRVLVLCLGLHFAIAGFFFGYLLTRLFLTAAFIRAEQLQRQIQKEVAVAVEGRVGRVVSEQATAVFEAHAAENEIFKALYAQPPDGFRRAIALAQRYVEGGRTPSAAVYAYLAAAYGQMFEFEQRAGSSTDVLDTARQRALDAAKQAIALDAFEKTRLAGLFNAGPDDPDNDLAVFQPFPEFHALLD